MVIFWYFWKIFDMYIWIVILYVEILLIFYCVYLKVLVVGFLVFVRVYVVLDKMEKSLEEEIVKENRKLLLNCFGRLGVFLYWWF